MPNEIGQEASPYGDGVGVPATAGQILKAENMNKAELSKAMASQTGLTVEKTNQVHQQILDEIATALKKDTVTLIGFGTFEKRDRSDGKTVKFIPGKKLQDALNQPE